MSQYGCLRKSQTGLKKNHIKMVPARIDRPAIARRLRSSSTCSINGMRASGPYCRRRERTALMREPRSVGVDASRRGAGGRLLGDRLLGDRLARHGLGRGGVLVPRLDRGRIVTAQALGLG